MPERPLRWLLMATHVPAGGQGGGIVRYTTELAASLQARPDVELHVLVTPASAPYFTGVLGDPARVHVVPALPTVVMSLFERAGVGLTRWRRRFDVVQGTKHLLPRGVAGTLVLTAHDMLLLDRPQDFGAPKRILLRRPYLASLRAADVVASVSAATRDRVGAHVPTALPRTGVVPLATSTALRTATPVPVAALEGARFALVVGDPGVRKNLPLVVDAWPEVVAAVPEAVLAVVGPDSWGETRYGAAFGALTAAGRIVSLSNVDDARLRWLYENATVVLCPSLAEGFGLPAVEALDLGAPLITSQDPALVEVSGDRAEHVPADRPDRWTTAIVAALRRERDGEDGRAGAAPAVTRTWDDVAAGTVELVRDARRLR